MEGGDYESKTHFDSLKLLFAIHIFSFINIQVVYSDTNYKCMHTF